MAMGFRSDEATNACVTCCTRGGTTTADLATGFLRVFFRREVLAVVDEAPDRAFTGDALGRAPGAGKEIRDRMTSVAAKG
jgi:hypothetical protein